MTSMRTIAIMMLVLLLASTIAMADEPLPYDPEQQEKQVEGTAEQEVEQTPLFQLPQIDPDMILLLKIIGIVVAIVLAIGWIRKDNTSIEFQFQDKF